MSRIPGNSPMAGAGDPPPQRVGKRPKQVLCAVILLCVSLLLGIPSTIEGYPATAAGIDGFYVASMLATYALVICVIVYLGKGGNWSRYVLLILTVLELLSVPEQVQKYSGLQLALAATVQLVNAAAVWLVFTRPGALWFTRTREADGTMPASPARHALGATFWIVATVAIVVMNPLIMGVPGILLFGIGDSIATAILGPDILARFHGDKLFDISTPMSIAWPVGAFFLWASFARHRADRAWTAWKWGLFLMALLSWNVVLATYFHLRVLPEASEASSRPAQPQPAVQPQVQTQQEAVSSQAGAPAAESAGSPVPASLTAKTLWKVALGARPLSGGPWVSDGLVIFHTMTMTDPPRGRLIAMAAQTGATVWEARTDEPAISSPALAGGTFYFGDGKRGLFSAGGRVVALQLATGKMLWEFPTAAAASSELIVRERMVHVQSGGHWHAIDRGNGKELWSVRAGGSGAYPPVLSGSTILLGSLGGRLVAVDADTGREKWKFSQPGNEAMASQHSVSGDKVVFRARNERNAGAIYVLDVRSGRVLLRRDARSGSGAPVADDKAVYFMDNRELVAVAIPGGARLWSLDLSGEYADYNTRLVSAGGNLYSVPLKLLKIDRATGAIEWKMLLEGLPWIFGSLGKMRYEQICAPLFEGTGKRSDLLHKLNLVAGNTAWTVRLTDFTEIKTIACEDRMLFYYDDRGSYSAYGVALLEQPSPGK